MSDATAVAGLVACVVAYAASLLMWGLRSAHSRSVSPELADLAKKMGLEVGTREVSGTVEGCQVRVMRRRILVDCAASTQRKIPSDLTVLSWQDGHKPVEAYGMEATTIGDPRFETLRLLGGDPATVAAVMSAEVREIIEKESFQMERGCISASSPRSRFEMENAIREALRLVDLLEKRAADVASSLVGNAREDPLESVAAANFDTLCLLGDGPERQAALVSCLGSRHVEIRLRAAVALGEEGVATLERLAASPEESGEDVAGRALAALAGQEDLTRAVAAVRAALSRRDGLLRVAALKAAGAAGDPGLEEEVAASLASPAEDVRMAAVHALERIGTVSSVLPLRNLHGSLLDLELRRAVAAAVAAIQSRIHGAAAGQVSVAGEDAGGRVSLADGAREGRLSLEGVEGEGGGRGR